MSKPHQIFDARLIYDAREAARGGRLAARGRADLLGEWFELTLEEHISTLLVLGVRR